MTPDRAETVALQALAWLLAQDDLRGSFLSATGASPADLAERAQDPGVLAATLRFLVGQDAWILAFCAAQGLPPTAPMQALAALPGGLAPDWT